MKDFFDSPSKEFRDCKSEWKARVIAAGLNCVHSLARHSKPLRKLSLRPVELRPQDAEPILHRYRSAKIAVPTPHRIAMIGSTNVQLMCGMPTPSRNPYPNVSKAVAPSEKPKACIWMRF